MEHFKKKKKKKKAKQKAAGSPIEWALQKTLASSLRLTMSIRTPKLMQLLPLLPPSLGE